MAQLSLVEHLTGSGSKPSARLSCLTTQCRLKDSLTLHVWPFRLPGFVFGRCRCWLAWAFRDLFFFPLLPHGVFDRFKAFVRNGVFLCPAQAQLMSQLFQRGFGVCVFVWHGQETSDWASSKH